MKKFKIITATLIAINITSCQYAKDKAQEGVNSALESAVEKQTGQEIDLADVNSYQDQKVEASFIYDGKKLLSMKENFSGSIVITKASEDLNLSFQLVNESGTSLMGVFSNFKEDYKMPLVGKFSISNANTPGFATATLVLMKLSESGMEEVPMPFEGSMTMTSLNEKVAEFEIDGKGGTAQNTNNSSTWKTITGKIKITNPAIQSMGIKKEQIIK